MPDTNELFVAECDYFCGFAAGPLPKSEVWKRAITHDKECLYGGPVIRNVKSPAPSWAQDPLIGIG